MCGIIGFTGKKNISKLSRLLKLIEHRGRDGTSLYYSNRIHLGMNRLAVIDLTRGLYPMKYKQYTLIFNGEIYNHKELKQRLSKQGISFSTTSDAEVILPLFALYGPKAFAMLEGMFAMAIVDRTKRQLILARDKSGEKPLYYMKEPSGIAFASEIKVLLSFEQKAITLDTRCIPQYLTQGFVFAPDTLVRHIKKVPPSNYLMYDTRTKILKRHQYWEPTHNLLFSLKNRNENDVIDRMEALLHHSVQLRLVADVPVGCFLSGGIDSSLVTLFASEEKRTMHTYSVSFPGYERYDESSFASFVAKRLKTKHTVVLCTPQNVRSLLDNIGVLIDEPIIDPAVLPTLLMAEEARKKVKVVLTGEGADELFGGYTRYAKQLFVERVRSIGQYAPLLLRLSSRAPVRRLRLLSERLVDRYHAQRVWTGSELTKLLMHNAVSLSQHRYLKQYEVINPLLSMHLTDYRGYMAEQLLMKIDKSTMANNLEARAPYLDTDIISFAINLTNIQQARYVKEKYILKKVAERYFPHSLVWRSKHGFDVPLSDWFRNELKSYVCQSFDNLSAWRPLFNVSYYRNILDDHMERKADNSSKIWSILVLTSWLSYYHMTL